MTSQFYSSLVINSKKFPNVHQVFRPRYNKIYYKRLHDNIGQVESLLAGRCKSLPKVEIQKRVQVLKANLPSLVKLCERIEKLEAGGKFNHEDPEHQDLKARFEEIRDHIMPITVSLPNKASKEVPGEDTIIDNVEPDFQAKEKLSKLLNYKKLSFINNCFFKSVVGPNSHYYLGIGAKLQHGLKDYFIDELEQHDFVEVSGLCLVRSAVVEATNSVFDKCYFTDPCRVLSNLDGEAAMTTMHLAEASRESLMSFVTSLESRSGNEPLRLMTSGAGYKNGFDWFDPDERKISQYETVHCLSLNSSVEQYSSKEYEQFRKIIWSAYKKLDIPLRWVHCSLDSMLPNEYNAHRVDVWLPSLQQWIEVSRMSYYLDHITVRTGLRRGHVIDSMVFDGRVLASAIIENNQTSLGKFIIPSVLQSHMLNLTPTEKSDYFRILESSESANINSPSPSVGSEIGPAPEVLRNFQQLRYMRNKRPYAFGHSKAADRMLESHWTHKISSPFILIAFIVILFDWQEIWYQVVPTRMKRFLYDTFYVRYRRFKNYLVYHRWETPPEVLTFDKIDKTFYEMTPLQRKKLVHQELSTGLTRAPHVVLKPLPPEERSWLKDQDPTVTK